MDPESKLLVVIDVGERTLAMAQHVVHQVVHAGARRKAAVLDRRLQGIHDGTAGALCHSPFPRRQAIGPAPKPRWKPLPGLLYAQVIKTVRHRVVFGTAEAVQQVLSPRGCQINTPRLWNASTSRSAMWQQWDDESARCVRAKPDCGTRWHSSRRTTTLVCPYTSLRQPLLVPEPTHGRGRRSSGALYTSHGSGIDRLRRSLREVLMYRAPPWPQPQAVAAVGEQ